MRKIRVYNAGKNGKPAYFMVAIDNDNKDPFGGIRIKNYVTLQQLDRRVRGRFKRITGLYDDFHAMLCKSCRRIWFAESSKTICGFCGGKLVLRKRKISF